MATNEAVVAEPRPLTEPDAVATDAVQVAEPRKRARAAVPKTRAPAQRHADEPAFVLHTWPYKETSLIVDALTRHHGRVSLVARGAKRPHSALRGLLLGFQPLALSWVGGHAKGVELRTLTRAEWVGGLAPLRGSALLCGFYLNELMQKLLARDDAHEALFDAYLHALAALAEGGPAAPTLRTFERVLLREAGYAMQLSHCADSGAPVEDNARYRYIPEHGPTLIAGRAARVGRIDRDEAVYTGKTLRDIERDDYADPATLAQAKLLMRHLLQHHLAGQVLATRQMMIDLQNL